MTYTLISIPGLTTFTGEIVNRSPSTIRVKANTGQYYHFYTPVDTHNRILRGMGNNHLATAVIIDI